MRSSLLAKTKPCSLLDHTLAWRWTDFVYAAAQHSVLINGLLFSSPQLTVNNRKAKLYGKQTCFVFLQICPAQVLFAAPHHSSGLQGQKLKGPHHSWTSQLLVRFMVPVLWRSGFCSSALNNTRAVRGCLWLHLESPLSDLGEEILQDPQLFPIKAFQIIISTNRSIYIKIDSCS